MTSAPSVLADPHAERMRRADALASIYPHLTKDDVVVVTIMGAVAVWFFLVRAIWRANLLDRFLGLDQSE